MPKVYITRPIPEIGPRLLEEKGYEVEINPEDRVLTKEELKEKVKGVDALLSLLTDKIDEEIFEAAGPQLKIVANYATGYDNIDLEAAKKYGVLVTNTPRLPAESVAEHTIALMLAIAKRIVEADKFVREGKYKGWSPTLFLGTELKDKTLGIIGLGQIGQRVAKKAVGLEMKVLYYDIKRNQDLEEKYGLIFKEIDEILPEADFVSLHTPLLKSTYHLIDKRRLELMKPTAYLINTARGAVIDEAALVEHLKAGKIQGAALDVYENEPLLTPGLADLENVVLTPHIASATHRVREGMARLAAENIIAALEGQTPPCLVESE